MADDLKQQNNYGFQGSARNDIISSLHDSILHHILSFLPTRDVVRTGILSKRWKSLWIGVSIFDISDFRSPSTSCWNFVERFLLGNGSGIQQFKLWFTSYATASNPRVQSMFSFLILHKIPHLDISLRVEDQFTLPCSIFDCQYLRILKLSIVKESRRKFTLELPDRISLPHLKVLCLGNFAFRNAESMEKLFSCCPVVEELALVDCKWIHRNSITISIPSLKRLTIIKSLEKYDFVDDDNSCCYIKVEAPALRSVNYTGTLTNLLYLSNMSSIQEFKLFFSRKEPSGSLHVQSLIAAIVSHKVEQLDIIIDVKDPFTLPCSIFQCQSLKILKISLKNTLELPDRISLPCLKVMHLHFCEFENANTIEKMFYCCHVLEELTLMDCKWIHMNSITISIPSLKRLTMGAEEYKYNYPVNDDNSCYITIEAPALLSFNYTGCLTNHLYLTKTSSSIKANIHMIWHYYYVGRRAPLLVKLLQGLENMISLTISNETAELLLLDSDHFPVFHHLEYLDLSLKLTGRIFQGLLKFFSFTPNLSTIRFSQGVDRTICQAGINWMPKPLPNCFLSSLKSLELGYVVGDSHELLFLTSYLEKAASLQKINIIQSKYITLDKQQLLRDEAEKLSTRFKNCAIHVQ